MDLLGGYGSSGSDGSDSDDDSSVQSATGPALPPAPAAAPAAAPSTTAPKAGGPGGTGGGISKKGRRLLSLGAVLPPEIFDRLTREQGGGGGDSSDSDASEYGGNGGNDDGGSDNQKKKRSLKRQKGATNTAASVSARSDVGSTPGEMGDFLRELRSAPSVGPGEGGQKVAASATSASNEPKEKEKLGMAFMSVMTTVTSKKDVGVEDIHAGRPSVGAGAASSSASGDDLKKPAADPSPSSTAPTPAPAPVPMVPTMRRAAAPVVAVPRPGLTAAPTVHGAAYAPQQQQYQQQQQQYQYQNQQQQHQHAQQHQQAAMGAQQSRKKSRKDLERSLRAGNFDALGDDARATTVHQDDLDYGAYAPTETDLSEAAARTAAANAAKAGAAGLRMCDPSAGGEVDVGGEVSQKHRSKHQINQLVAKAAVLEAHRAGGVGPSGQRTVKGSNSRADAKRKYGW